MMIENKKFRMEVNKEGYVSNLTMKDDPYQMNWMIEDSYLQEKNYKDADKLFGFFELIADKEKFGSQMSVPVLKETEKGIEVVMNALAGTPTVVTADFANEVEQILREKIQIEKENGGNCHESRSKSKIHY